MRCLVTGHLGFIGSWLYPSLRQFYDDITGFDLLDGRNILHSHLPPADIVFHLAAQPGVVASMEDPAHTMLTNVFGTTRLCDHYQNARFIFASSGGTIQETIESPYGLSKKVGEDYLKMMHPDAVILRFANVYGSSYLGWGSRSRSVIDKFLREDELTIYGDGSATRTYVHVKDLVRGILSARRWPAGTYCFGTDQHHSVQEIADATGKPIRYEDWRPGELRYSSLENTAPRWEPTIDALSYIEEALCLTSVS